jgi:hypothetical protein
MARSTSDVRLAKAPILMRRIEASKMTVPQTSRATELHISLWGADAEASWWGFEGEAPLTVTKIDAAIVAVPRRTFDLRLAITPEIKSLQLAMWMIAPQNIPTPLGSFRGANHDLDVGESSEIIGSTRLHNRLADCV